jgi:hypothetical protein
VSRWLLPTTRGVSVTRGSNPQDHLALAALLLGAGATEALVRFTEALLLAIPSLVS